MLDHRKSVARIAGGLFIIGLLAAALCFFPPIRALAGPDRISITGYVLGHGEAAKPKYSEFPHSAKAHRMECSKCHKFPSDNWKTVRAEKDAFPDVTSYPRHESCLNCHRQQFFRGAKPQICSICHVNAFPPRDPTRWPFPNPRETFDASLKGKTAQSDFVVAFPHDKHIEIVSQNGTQTPFVNVAFTNRNSRFAEEESCAVCHQTYKPQGDSDDEYFTKPPKDLGDKFWLKKGTFKTAPTGHTTCFTCHSADTGILPAPENCAACHTLRPPQPKSDFDPKLAATMKIDDKIMLDAWKTRHSAGAFRHEWFSHAELSCSTCHNVATMKTADPATQKVSITACAVCHVTKTADDGGALNYEAAERAKNANFQCVKCHISFGSSPIPDSHKAALEAAK